MHARWLAVVLTASLSACSSGSVGDASSGEGDGGATDDGGGVIQTLPDAGLDVKPPPPLDGAPPPTDSGTPPPPTDSGTPPPPTDSGTPPPPTDSGRPPPVDSGPPPTCAPYKPPSLSCGSERWEVKVGEDYAAACAIRIDAPTASTIDALTSIPHPASLPSTSRVAPTETTEYVLHDVVLTGYVHETDSDYHLVLQDPSSGRTMIAEIPDPACVPSSGDWSPLIIAARKTMDAKLRVSTTFTTTSMTISVRGIGFFDTPHSQRGLAPNAIELHPVLGICFGAGCTP